jgi:hypothetical protein
MANILNIETDAPPGLVDVSPNFIYLETEDTQSAVMAPGYLNSLNLVGETITKDQIACITTSDMPAAVYNINVNPSTKVITLTYQGGGSGDVSYLAPVLPNRIAVFTDNVGTIGDPIGTTVVHVGDIQAGINAISGGFISYPPASSSGTLIFKAINNSSNSNVTIVNDIGSGTNTVATIPFSGFSAYKFLVSDYSGEQFVQHGDFSIARGNLSVYGGNSLKCLSPTANSGGIWITAANNSGNFAANITNDSLSRNITYTLPNPGASTAHFLINTWTTSSYQPILLGGLQCLNGDFVAGQNGASGEFISYSNVTNSGTFRVKATPCADDVIINLTNSPALSSGGSNVYNFLLPPGATEDQGDNNILIAVSTDNPPPTAGHFVQFATTTNPGYCQDVGIAITAHAVTDPGHGTTGILYFTPDINPGSIVTMGLYSSNNPVSILSYSTTVSGLIVNYTADPGATVIGYINFSGELGSLSNIKDFDYESSRAVYLEEQQKFYQNLKQKDKVWYRKIVKKLLKTIFKSV